MQAVVWRGVEQVQVEDLPEPGLADRRAAIVDVVASSICGSDLHLYHGAVPVVPGTVLGHEAIGVVRATGTQVERVKPGDRVLIAAVVGCGLCPSCRTGYAVGCETLPVKVLGVSPFLAGVQAERVAVPYADYNLWPLPEEIDDLDALLLTDIFPTGLYAAESAAIVPGDTVVVIGCGPVGLCAIQCAQLFGAGLIVAIDPVAERREWAGQYGARALPPGSGAAAAVRELTGGRGADAVIEAVGSEQTLRLAVELVRTGGRVVMVGVLVRDDVPFPLGASFLKDVTFRAGLVSVPQYLPRLFALVRHGRLQPRKMITHHFSLSDAVAAYRTFDRREGGCLKVCLRPGP
ncbi:MAG: zinc-binding dehydrogenase [Candidatus Binatia bacterium]|nr:zinc-binding dehydrogenase [Candidatus Binatia bacterium]